ncbi:MAG: serine/threonine protein kinase [Planctomycetota bacterium]|nr:serine/threonine protein kinase [Planctomycetota bacterium]
MDSLFDHDAFATEARADPLDAALLALAEGWADGRNPRVEELIRSRPLADPHDLVELVYHEFCLAEAAGLAPDPAGYLARFPAFRAELSRLLGLHDAFRASTLQSLVARPGNLPESGDEIGPYRLLRELGRGGLARVFLAEQADLGDRLVVLKVAARPSPEALLLARARHPHIVEVLRRAETGDGGLQMIAMPFLGGATLEAVLSEQAKRGPKGRRTGRDLLEALDRVAAPEFLAADSTSASRGLLAGASHARAAAWIVARLAEALQHASRLGVTHGDLKPANILLASDARPMLFDFNLAVDWRSPDAELAGVTGGTLAYMAPERLRALAEPKLATVPRAADRHRADLYALGLVLREILTGQPPVVPEIRHSSPRAAATAMADARTRADASRWSCSRGIPAGLRPVLDRCLAPDPADRYGTMAELAEDLDRWRTRRPLLHASTPPDPAARLLRWASRRGAMLGIAAALGMIAVLVALMAGQVLSSRLRYQAEAKLAALWDSGDPAIFRPRRFGEWKLDDDAAEFARRNLDHYGVSGPEDWRSRDDVRALNENDRADLEMWLLEQTWRLANAWGNRPNSPEDWQRALALLERSPDWASLATFDSFRRALRERLHMSASWPASAHVHAGWLDRYAAGIEAETNDARKALSHYDAASAARPECLWPRYRASVVAARLGNYRLATQHLARCLELHPRNPALWTLKAGCLMGSEKADDALQCCNRALELDPDFLDAYILRCFARTRLGQSEGLEADAARLAQLSQSRGRTLSLGLSLTLGGFAGRRDEPATVATEAANIQALIAAQFERAGQTEKALEAFDRTIAGDPEHLWARHERARLLLSLRRNQGMNDMAAVVAHSRFEELVREQESVLCSVFYVVNWHLRMGATREARELAERALALSLNLRESGLPESPMVAESRYALARTLAPDIHAHPELVNRAADYLFLAGLTDTRLIDDRFGRDSIFDTARGPIVARLNFLRNRAAIHDALPGGQAHNMTPH